MNNYFSKNLFILLLRTSVLLLKNYIKKFAIFFLNFHFLAIDDYRLFNLNFKF